MQDLDLSLFSGHQIQQLTNFKKEINAIYENHLDLIKERNTQDFFDFVSLDGKFHWAVNGVKPNKDNIVYGVVTYVPESFASRVRATSTLRLTEIAMTFDRWVKDVVKYKDALNEYYDPFYKQFEKEFEDSFGEENEEDKHTTLSSDEQLKVCKLLTYIEEGLKKEDTTNPEIQKLIFFTTEFKEKVPFLPKSGLKKRSIKLISELKRLGIKLYYDTIEIGYKEIIKTALISGVHAIGSVNAGHIISQVLQ